jgi:putative adenylate-forming enzyme
MMPVAEALLYFVQTRRLMRSGLNRAGFEAWQHNALSQWLAQDLPRAPAYGKPAQALSDLPVTDKAALMANFAAFNTAGVTAEQAWAAIPQDGLVRGLTVGASTGTSGNRGLFVISETERFRWLGAMLAKTMADLMWRPRRVAIVLPRDTRLYHAARRSRWIDLRFFDLTQGLERWQAGLEGFAPDVIVAPPRALREMAERHFRLTPLRIFSAAETLDPIDRPLIEAHFRQPLHQIYMATEGLLAVTCRHGRLHLAEDSVHFEFSPVGDGLVSPIITAFRRQTQIMARYRMNDLLRLSPAPCACGSALRAVDEVVGRMDDCFHLPGGLITPDVLRNAVVDADRRVTDFRLWQTGADTVTLVLPPDLPEDAGLSALTSLRNLLTQQGKMATVTLVRQPLAPDPLRKLRRVERRWHGGTAPRHE